MTASVDRFTIAILLDGKGGGRELSDSEVDAWKPGDGLLWVDIDQNSKEARRWMKQQSGLDANIAGIVMAGETRPRSLAEAEGLVVVLRGINMNPGAEPDDMVAVRMWLECDRIITSRRRKVVSVLDVRDSLLAGRGPTSTGSFLVTLAQFLNGRIESAIDKIERQLEVIEERLVGGDLGSVRTELGTLRRHTAALRRHLSPQRDALDRLARSGSTILAAEEAFALREEGDDLTRHVEDLDLARETALVTQEELLNRVAQEQNARMYLLSIVAAIFLPLTFVTGLLGMNVAGLPGTVNPNGFVFSALLMVLLGAALVAVFKWKRWL